MSNNAANCSISNQNNHPIIDYHRIGQKILNQLAVNQLMSHPSLAVPVWNATMKYYIPVLNYLITTVSADTLHMYVT